ncbi:phosphoadenosine phosphosulfate reductase family protein [Photobacterium kishitanii]|uniref:Phosphoadenosine phosphosulphate reductase domain-containing protein n=1 Tax=Photobacterium kishitanii TaxID=318456 RepID=A0A2T3KB15_9GAMM|nr:phosphoadenosine phosphosulfate reductase family protein [Photobacterium kishitanii]PSU89795.1 hypothetical protein C9J27_24240 [Photobacterium kishitanii]
MNIQNVSVTNRGTKLNSMVSGNITDEFFNRAEALIDHVIPDWDYKISAAPNTHYVLGLSGGVDSSALAAVMLIKHPEIPFKLLFCDTGDEPENVGEIITLFSQKFGADVTVATPPKSLYESIDNNGYLPSGKQRWCTASLKIKPWEDYMATLFKSDEETAVNFSGLRYDERDRKGILGVARVTSEHPFIDQKVERAAVVRLAAGLGVLSSIYFQGKSRSGCLTCFFQSKAETCSLYNWHPKSFMKAMKVEKLSPEILAKLDDSKHPIMAGGWYAGYPFSNMIIKGKYDTVYTDSILGGTERTDKEGFNWDYLTLDKPTNKNRKKKVSEQQIDMIGFNDLNKDEQDKSKDNSINLYVAVEHVSHPMMIAHCGVYEQRIITYSTTQSGLSRSINGYFYHRTMVSDGYYGSKERYKEQSNITVLCIKFSRGIIPEVDYDDGSYTWKPDISYAETAHTLRAISRIANYEYQKQQTILTNDIAAKEYVQKIDEMGINIGKLIGVGHFTPIQRDEELRDFSYDEDVKTVRCVACSL